MIPIEDHKWHSIGLGELPEGHRAEAARYEDGFVVRITGPNANVFGKDGNLTRAVDKALEWFSQVGQYLG